MDSAPRVAPPAGLSRVRAVLRAATCGVIDGDAVALDTACDPTNLAEHTMSNPFKTVAPSPLLKSARILDAAVTAASAALQLAAPDWLSQTLALPRALLFETGIFFVAYVALLAVMARSGRLWSGLVGLVVVGNAGWALAGIGLLLAGVLTPNALGLAFVAVQCLAVLAFAALQFKGLAVSRPATSTTGAAPGW